MSDDVLTFLFMAAPNLHEFSPTTVATLNAAKGAAWRAALQAAWDHFYGLPGSKYILWK